MKIEVTDGTGPDNITVNGGRPTAVIYADTTLPAAASAVTSVNGQTGNVTGLLEADQNLADLTDPAAARTSLALGAAATLNVGTTAGTVAAGDDTRLTNPRTPTAHAASHATAGSDPIAPAAIGALTEATADSRYLLATTRGAASGVASLDSGTKVPAAQIPDLSGTYATLAAYGNIWTPADHGLIAWSMDPSACTAAGTTLSAGFIYLIGIQLRQAATITKVHAVIGAAGSGLTAGQCLAGLYDSSGTRRGVTADMSTTWNTTGSKAMNLTSSYAAPAGRYYVALLHNGTTSPTFACGSTLGATFTPGNANLTSGSYRYARSAAGQTSLPASITLSGYTPDANNVWAAAS